MKYILKFIGVIIVFISCCGICSYAMTGVQSEQQENAESNVNNQVKKATLLYGVFYNREKKEEVIFPCYYVEPENICIHATTGKPIEESYHIIGDTHSTARYIETSEKVQDSLFELAMEDDKNRQKLKEDITKKLGGLFVDLNNAKLDYAQQYKNASGEILLSTAYEKPLDVSEEDKLIFGETVRLSLLVNLVSGQVYAYEGIIPNERSVVSKEEMVATPKEIQKKLENIINKMWPNKLQETKFMLEIEQEEETGITNNIATFKWQRVKNNYPVRGDGFKIEYDLFRGKIVSFEMAWSQAEIPKMDNQLTEEKAIQKATQYWNEVISSILAQ